MKLVSDEYIEFWLDEVWDGTLDWDIGNVGKLRKHKLTQDDVRYLLSNPFSLEGQIEEPVSEHWNEKRYLILGKIESGSAYSLVFTTRETQLRVVTCRRMRPNEEKNFEKFLQETKD